MTEPSWLIFAHGINPANNTATRHTITALGCLQDSWRGTPIAPPANLKIQAENASPSLLAWGRPDGCSRIRWLASPLASEAKVIQNRL
ncbi:hypothetical protein N7471_004692 [Penicillium samsonianum]|uniref:uncharacterized protein n=1 Tax=Penicillium samsonianum TaxID=1882272 RepID=UPI002547A30D|nr:uncharacterized protein N7471_004692 [Penicillium samsonianum]KAJ6138206.1 hypothetical protein N7471_004692 [Penicillium samsonianum]